MDPEVRLQQLRRRLRQERCVFLILLSLGSLLLYFTALKHRVCAILVDGREEVYVSDPATARDLLIDLLQEKAPQFDLEEYGPGGESDLPDEGGDRLTPDLAQDIDDLGFVQEVAWRQVIRRGQPLSTPDEARKHLASKLEVNLPAATLWVDGQRHLALPNEAVARQVLDSLKALYAGRHGSLVEEPDFKQAVEIREEYVPVEEICSSVEEGISILSGGPATEATYEVQPGDLAIHIARKHHLTLAQLRELNPERNLNRLKVGEKLRVTEANPLLTVVTVEEKSFETELPPSTQTIPDPSLAPGQRVIKRPGKPGKVRVWVRLTYENGREVARQTVAQETLNPPVPEEVHVGPEP